MSKKGFKRTCRLNQIANQAYLAQFQTDVAENTSMTRVITICYEDPKAVEFEQDNVRYFKLVPMGERRIVRVSPACKDSEWDIARYYGGFIIDKAPRKIRV